MSLDKKIFKDKTLSDLFEEIYNNSRKKDKQINGMVGELQGLIEGVEDATLVVPMIKEYLEIAVKNDKHLVDMASIVQRLVSIGSGKTGDMFDPSEIQAILDEIEQPIPRGNQRNQDNAPKEDV